VAAGIIIMTRNVQCYSLLFGTFLKRKKLVFIVGSIFHLLSGVLLFIPKYSKANLRFCLYSCLCHI